MVGGLAGGEELGLCSWVPAWHFLPDMLRGSSQMQEFVVWVSHC